ncbi:MAG: universal stress protein [Isosphaeraceae bacterium]
MPRFVKVLVCVSTERGEQAVREKLARILAPGGVAELVTVIEPFSWYSRLLGSASDLADKLLADARARLESQAGALRQLGLNVDVRVLQGKRSLELTRAVVEGHHDLVLKEADDDRPGLLGLSDIRVIRSCPAPVWIFRPTEGPCRVLAAVNPREEGEGEHYDPFGLSDRVEPSSMQDPIRENALNRRILDLAAWATSLGEGTLHVAHAWRVPGEERLRQNPHVDAADVNQYVDTIRGESEARFKALVDDFDRGRTPVVRHLEKGWAAETIEALVERERISLLVMGSVARTGIAGYVIGNTAESLLGRIRCSVLAIKPEGFVSPVAGGRDPAQHAAD